MGEQKAFYLQNDSRQIRTGISTGRYNKGSKEALPYNREPRDELNVQDTHETELTICKQ
jgi:hypothetical protein